MPERIVNSELYILFTKVLIPSFLTILAGIAIEAKNGLMKISPLNIFLSMTIGLTGAYICSEFIFERLEGGQATLAISLTTLLSEKIGKFILLKLPIDSFLTALVEGLFDYISNLFKIKK